MTLSSPINGQTPPTTDAHDDVLSHEELEALGMFFHGFSGTPSTSTEIPEVTEPLAAAPEPPKKDTPKSKVTVGPESPDLDLLFTILSYRRGHGSKGEEAFINEVLLPFLQKTEYELVVKGPNHDTTAANIVVFVPNSDNTRSNTLFSCHLDTVHQSSDIRVRQKLDIDPALEHVFLSKNEQGCLGADDGGGVWLLMQMIRFGKPGVYVFHRGEERGCIGSNWMALHEKDWLSTFKHAVAFDRKDTGNVITHQRGRRCCSQGFAQALADALNKSKFSVTYAPDHTGMYTDTANYASLIPECTNLSIGYENAHGNQESLNYHHLDQLFGACYNLDWDSLPAARDPKTNVYDAYGMSSTHGSYHGSYHGGSSNNSNWRTPTPPAPSPALTPTLVGGSGKRNKKSKNRPVTDTHGRISTTEEFSQADLANLTFVELQDMVEGLDSETVAYIIGQLIEECDGWKARLRAQRRLAGYSL